MFIHWDVFFLNYPKTKPEYLALVFFLYDENGNKIIGLNKIKPDGTYGFMVPNGKYRLVVFDNGENIYDGRIFNVSDNIVNKNIGLSLWEQIIESARETANMVNEQVLDNPIVENANTYIAPTVFTSVSVSTVVSIPWWSLVRYLQYFFTEPLAWLFRRKKRGWGVVYDSISKQPIDLAVVRLYSKKTGNLISSKVTDSQGRYTFLVSEGDYLLEVVKPSMIFPSKVLANIEEDKEYTDIYHGETITIGKEQKGVITANIPVDSQEEKISDKEILKNNFWYKIRKKISIVGPLFSMISFVISPTVLIGSFTVFHLFLFLLFKRLVAQKEVNKWGIILDAKNGKPLSQSIVRIFSPEYNKMLETQVTDRHGKIWIPCW
jgi:hypothetical protein